MNRSLNVSSLTSSPHTLAWGREEVSIVPRGTPPAWLTRWQLASTLQDRLEMIYGNGIRRPVLRLVQRSRNYRELIRHYSNETML